MRNTKQAFTLVELIVVITILAILGTIAFISLQGYSSDARNTKRTNDLSSIQSAISVKQTEGASLLAFITGVDGSKIENGSIGGTGVTTSDYNAGTVNFTALGIKQADFQDPQDSSDYAIGGTTKLNGKFELAASIENGGGAEVAKLIGNYNDRTLATSTASGTVSNGVITLDSSSDINKMVSGDYVVNDVATANTAKIIKVSADGKTLTTDNTTLTGTTFQLALAESTGLIDAGSGTSTGVIVDAGSTYLPY